MTRLEVSDLVISSNAKTLVGPVSFTLVSGTALTILGETGAGKSLIAQVVLGAVPRSLKVSGSIVLDGRPLNALPLRDRQALMGRRIAMLPQEPWRALDPTMACGEQVEETYRFVAGLDQTDARRNTASDFSQLGLEGAQAKLPGALSGGMAQRTAFAASRAGGASLLLADEPTKGLDAALRDQVVALLKGSLEQGGAVLTITHDVTVARALGGDVMILRNGVVVEAGPAETVLTAPRSDYGLALVDAEPSKWPQLPPARSGDSLISLHDVTIVRGRRTLLSNFNLQIKAGERVAVTGPSGIGKSSLLDCISGLLAPAGGRVERSPRLGRYAVQKLYQDPPSAFPPRIVLGQTLKDLVARHGLSWGHLEKHLIRLGIAPGLLARRPNEVSGGELQRIALARVLALGPDVILADEPTSRLDPVTQKNVMTLPAEVGAEAGTALVLVTHSRDIPSRWADREIAFQP